MKNITTIAVVIFLAACGTPESELAQTEQRMDVAFGESTPGLTSPVMTANGQGYHGAVAQGSGNGSGLVAQGAYGLVGYGAPLSGVVGRGGEGYPGVEAWAGTDATPEFHQTALALKNGNLVLEGPNPLPGVPFKNALTPANVVKAWARIHSDGFGSLQLMSGFNIASVAVNGPDARVTFAGHMQAPNYVCTASSTSPNILTVISGAADSVNLEFFEPYTGRIKPISETGAVIHMICTGLQ